MPNYNLSENLGICGEIVAEASELLFYSHIPTAVLALLIGAFILYKTRGQLLGRLLFSVTFLFSLWTALDLIVWLQFDNSDLLMFAWSLFGLVHILLYLVSFYFVSVFITKRDVSTLTKLIYGILVLPILILLPTTLNLKWYNATDCIGAEGLTYTNYYLFLGLAFAVAIILFTIVKWRTIQKEDRPIVFNLVTGIEAFLLFFFAMVWGIDYLVDIGYIAYGNYSLEQYGLFSMPIFMGLLAYMTVKFKIFNVKLAAAQALVIGLVFLIASQFFFVKTITNYALVGITLVLSAIGGYYLVKSVKREIKQREEIEKLAKDLEKANVRLKELDKQKSEFVSIASHQLRSPLTAIRGYASMLAEGSFGKLPGKAMESAQRIEESAKLMAISIEDYLNVSRIESGNMKYSLSDFNLRDMVDNICDDLRPEAMKHNLILLFRSDISSRGIVHADVGKTSQIIHNLINNSLKYTPKGSISVLVRDDVKKKRVYIEITDTGIGMSEKTQHTIFQKFERAHNANSVNVSGTGLGLFVALKMAEAMGGTISAHSEGDGKGSTFTFELPLAM